MNSGYTPEDERIEPENDALEDDFPFPGSFFSGSMLIVRGVVIALPLKAKDDPWMFSANGHHLHVQPCSTPSRAYKEATYCCQGLLGSKEML